MKRFFAAALLAIASISAHAQNIDTTGLTKEQISQLAAKANEMKDPKNISEAVRQEASAWGELGVNMGRAVVGAAKEVGVAANEFAVTPLGKVVVALVVYKIAGQDFLGVVFGTLTLIVGTTISIWIATRNSMFGSTFEYKPVLWGLYHRKVVTSTDTNYTGAQQTKQLMVVGAGIVLVLTWLVGLNTIF